MIRRYVLPLIAAALIIFAAYQVYSTQRKEPMLEPQNPPPGSPFRYTVAGAGVVEAHWENIQIAPAVPGLVLEIYVEVGQRVSKGSALLRVDDRHLRAQLEQARAQLKHAEAQLAKLQAMPRPEEVLPARARVAAARRSLEIAEDLYQRVQRLWPSGNIAEEEYNQRRLQRELARHQLEQAEAELRLLEAGAWEQDLAIARAQVEQAQAQIRVLETEIERALLRAPIDGVILQRNVRPGEYIAVSFPGAPPAFVLGDLSEMRVRVDIDEYDIPRLHPGAAAKAYVRGYPRQEYSLRFVRIDPYVVPKKSLTGENTERVDTRVLQVIYAVEKAEPPLYVGQQLDVFIEAGS
ncbi:MAG: efflux RND transporter periplasmic adaptor subunit [Gemmatales bacterium]|nr:efflux RND transporter periplasmic adaptor subunit [Gemmatales bacterium]MCS7159942.1 efflux RND transporter periplasmic adaptor subunit [Gemmatales bacterium]MDW8175141.1 efflux RND transporter periplasmic adaptor subunit [Gemmatales bacterium]MDW8221652.1 efflux RND transporter periplasmic adaptor subunit [Gemmatales bacterium]